MTMPDASITNALRNPSILLTAPDTRLTVALHVQQYAVFMDLDAFKQVTTPAHRRSKLDPFSAEIAALLVDGYSYAQVVTWLEGKGISITKQSLGEWVQRRKRDGPLGANVGSYEPTSRQAPTVSYDPEPTAKPLPTPSSSPAALDSIIGKPVNLDAYAKQRRKKK